MLESVRKLIDTVDSVFPDVTEDGPRRTIIDSAFKMVEQLVGAVDPVAAGHTVAISGGSGNP